MDSNSETFQIKAQIILCTCQDLASFSTNIFFSFPVAKKIDELQETLRKKDEDMKQMEERYKRYVEKARTVSPTEHS